MNTKFVIFEAYYQSIIIRAYYHYLCACCIICVIFIYFLFIFCLFLLFKHFLIKNNNYAQCFLSFPRELVVKCGCHSCKLVNCVCTELQVELTNPNLHAVRTWPKIKTFIIYGFC